MWKALALRLDLSRAEVDAEMQFCGNPDFHVVQKACDKLKLTLEAKKEMHEVIMTTLSDRCAESGMDCVPPSAVKLVASALEIHSSW